MAGPSPTPPPGSTPPPRGASTRCPRLPAATPTTIVAGLVSGELGGLVVGGVDPDDTSDPAATRAALDAASFVVALELRETDVTRAADVVFPVAPVVDKAGTFVNWEGRLRSFDAVFSRPGSLPDLRVLAGISEELARSVTVSRSGSGLSPRPARRWRRSAAGTVIAPLLPRSTPSPARALKTKVALASWKQMIDNGSLQDGEEHLRATARITVVAGSPQPPTTPWAAR